MLLKELDKLIANPLLAEDVPIIANVADGESDVPFTIRLEQNLFGRWAVMIDIES